MQLLREIVGGEEYEYYPLGEYIVRAHGVCEGRLTFKYTRIEISGALDRLGAGEPFEQLVAGYRSGSLMKRFRQLSISQTTYSRHCDIIL